MRATRSLVLLAALAAAGCATRHGHFDRDAAADFAAYRSFAIVSPELATEELPLPSGDVARSQLVERRVRAALERELAAKGLAPAPAASAQLLVAFHVSSRRATRTDVVPGGLPPRWPRRWWHDYWDDVYTRVYTEGLMIVDLIDARTRRLVWRGWTTDPLPPSGDPTRVVDHAVREILENYPPPAAR